MTPEGLRPLKEVGIYGKIAVIKFFRPPVRLPLCEVISMSTLENFSCYVHRKLCLQQFCYFLLISRREKHARLNL